MFAISHQNTHFHWILILNSWYQFWFYQKLNRGSRWIWEIKTQMIVDINLKFICHFICHFIYFLNHSFNIFYLFIPPKWMIEMIQFINEIKNWAYFLFIYPLPLWFYDEFSDEIKSMFCISFYPFIHQISFHQIELYWSIQID